MLIARAVGILLFVSMLSTAQVPDEKAEALVVCPDLSQPEPVTPYGFAKATLVSLWYARNGANRATEIQDAGKGTGNYFSFLTGVMRITKNATNDFICAKRSVKPFAVKQSGENISQAADFMVVVYDAHISINQRMIDVLKKMDSTSQAALADQISTLQVERDQRWADLVTPASLAFISLIDLKRADQNGKVTWLVISKAQKKTLQDWANQHFAEFTDGTPKGKWSDPSKTAEMYSLIFNGRKGSDE